MKQNTAMNGHVGIASPIETTGTTTGVKTETQSENMDELLCEKENVKEEMNELGENEEDTPGAIMSDLNSESILENLQSEFNEHCEIDKKNKTEDKKEEIQGKKQEDIQAEINENMECAQSGKCNAQGEMDKKKKVERNKVVGKTDTLNGEMDKEKNGEINKVAGETDTLNGEMDKEKKGEINKVVGKTDTLNDKINKQVEDKYIKSEINKHSENLEDHQGETNIEKVSKEENQSEICGDINLEDENTKGVKNKGAQNEPYHHDKDEKNIKSETTDSSNSRINIDEFFKKYDEIILNSPVLSDTGEDEEMGQGHDGNKGQDNTEKKGNMFHKLKQDKAYRRKLLHTAFLCWSFVVLGWIIGQFGPSFLDLQVITHTRLEEGSAFMTSHSVGYLFGSLISGILFDKFNKLVLLFSAIAGNGITVVVIPWCVLYEMMIAIHTVKGLFSGGLDALGNAYLVYVWGDENGSYMQALHFAFALGGIISPLATAPFLVPRHHDDIPSTVAMTTPSTNWNSTIPDQNNTVLMTPSLYLNNMTNSSTISNEEPEFFKIESRVYIAYLISALLAFSAAFPFLYMHLKSGNKNGVNSKQEEKSDTDDRKLPLRQKVLIMINMMCMMGIYSAIEDTYAGFLTTFVVQQLNWTKTLGSYATSFYWAAFGTGRFFGIFLVKFCFPVRMISIYCMLLVLAFVGLVFSSTAYFDEGLWVCVPLAGLALSIIFPTVFTWTEEELLPVTGKVASLFLIASSSGTMINPIVLGFLMDELTPMYFCYLLLGESIILFLLYVSALCLSRNIQKGKIINEGHLDIELPVKSNSEPELYKGEDEGLLAR